MQAQESAYHAIPNPNPNPNPHPNPDPNPNPNPNPSPNPNPKPTPTPNQESAYHALPWVKQLLALAQRPARDVQVKP